MTQAVTVAVTVTVAMTLTMTVTVTVIVTVNFDCLHYATEPIYRGNVRTCHTSHITHSQNQATQCILKIKAHITMHAQNKRDFPLKTS